MQEKVIVVGGGPSGTVAALAVKSGCSCRKLDVMILRETLKNTGVVLP